MLVAGTVPTHVLVTGHLDVWKNGEYVSGAPSQLLHDLDLQLFKIVSKGNILLTFRAQDVTGWDTAIQGIVNKKQATGLHVKFATGDEYTFNFRSPDMQSFQRTRAAIGSVIRGDLAIAEIARTLKVKDRVAVAEVCQILTRFNLSNTLEDGQARIEACIASDSVEGSFDGREFVNKRALERESVHYEIVAKFELQKNGVIVFNCPSCGASLTPEGKEPTGACGYCGSSYTLPRKLLDMI
ncbi:MAG: hypothetical protein JRN58_03100 [Nitrososphaerota archaeon]|nr:hypothetical protein [Nitrososphaerota archaeon]